MTLKTVMSSDMTSVFTNADDFGETAVYTSVAGVDTADVPVVVAQSSNFTEMGYHGGQAATIVIPKSAVASPEIHATLTIGTDVYRIDMIENQDSAASTVLCTLDQRQTPNNLQGA